MTHHARRRRTSGLPDRSRTLRHLLIVAVALVAVLMAMPVASPATAQETGGTVAIEVHVSECPPGYTGSSHFDDCHANGIAGVDVQLSGAVSDTKTTEGNVGAVRFSGMPAGTHTIQLNVADEGQQYRTYCSMENSDEQVPMSPGDANPGSVDLGEGQVVICDFYVIPAAESEPEATVVPTAEPTAPAGSTAQAQITVNPVACPEGTGADAGFDALDASCAEPVENVTFTWGNETGTLETINTSDNDPSNGENGLVIIDEIEEGTYTLFSDIPLEFAQEVLYCVADGGNRYQKEFDESGVTTFTNIQREQIVCDWFILPYDLEGDASETPTTVATQDPVVTPTTEADSEDARGVESGGSLVVHLAACEEGYDGDTIFDDCHGSGVADQEFVLTGPDGEMSAITEVPQTPGPGIVEFTGLSAGDYTLAGGPPVDFGSVRLYCTTQPNGEFVDTSFESTRATFSMGEGDDVLCDWYYIPESQQGDETPEPPATVTPEPVERAEILVTLYACEPGMTFAGAGYGDFADACDETRDGVPFNLGDPGAPPLTANTGASGAGAVRFYDLLPADYTLTPNMPSGLTSAAVFCQLNGGDLYQKTLTNGATTFVNVDGDSVTCDWFAIQPGNDPAPEPHGPTGSITVREFLCEKDQREIEDWEQECVAGSTGVTYTVGSTDGAITLTSATNSNGVATFTELPDGFYTLEQNDGIWCKARAERVDSQSRVIVEDGQNTDVFLYQCAQVTDLPSTGTGPGISAMGDGDWWSTISGTQLALMGVGVLGAMILMVRFVTRRLSV